MVFVRLILFSLIMLTPARAQIHLDIIHDRSSGARLPGVPDSGFKDSLSVVRFLHGVTRSLHEQAFMEASVDSVVGAGERFSAFMHTGPAYNYISVTLDSIDIPVLRSCNINRSKYENRILDLPAFRILQNKLLSYYEDSGYPFASVSFSSLEIRGDTLYGNLAINKNRRYLIGNIHILGDQPVKNTRLYRHLGIYPGDTYSENNFKRAGDLLRNTEFLSEIRPPEIEFMPESADLYLYIERRQASNFSGIIGIMPGDGRNKTRLAGELDLGLINVFSRMETLSIRWHSPGNGIQQIELQGEQPWLFGRPFGADFHLLMYRQDTTWLNVEAGAGILFSIPGGGVIRAYWKTFGSMLIGNNNTGISPGALNDAAGITGRLFGISYRHSRIGHRINPHRGWEMNASAGAGNKQISLPPENQGRRSGLAEGGAILRLFVPVTRSTTFMLANLSGIKLNTGAGREQDYFFVNELYLLGGLHSIRGFDERSLAASSYVIQRVEYRYLFDETGNIFLFFDGMAYRQKLHNRIMSDLPLGFGAGLTLGTRAGQFSLSYGLGMQHGNPPVLRSAKIHIGVTSRF
jgi:outer membrane protein assembly factor BamA